MDKPFLPHVYDLYTEKEWDEVRERIRKSTDEFNNHAYFVGIDNRIRTCLKAEFPIGNWVQPWLTLYERLLKNIQYHRQRSKSTEIFLVSAPLLEQGIRRMEVFLEFWNKVKPPEELSSRG